MSINLSRQESVKSIPNVGIGLRSEHYQTCMEYLERSVHTNSQGNKEFPDFVEIHAENFFMDGGIVKQLLVDLCKLSPVSIHGTSLGLASHTPIPAAHIKRFARLVDEVNPILVSDHACLAWFTDPNTHNTQHAGDLLPFAFDKKTLEATVRNVTEVQQVIGRQLLVENLSSYLSFDEQSAPSPLCADIHAETDFYNELCKRSGCKLLVDLNNLVVNAHNMQIDDAHHYALSWLDCLDSGLIGEYHIAGCTPAAKDKLMVDDHSQPVSQQCWQLLPEAQRRCEAPVMIERDNNLPAFSELLDEVVTAKRLLHSVSKN